MKPIHVTITLAIITFFSLATINKPSNTNTIVTIPAKPKSIWVKSIVIDRTNRSSYITDLVKDAILSGTKQGYTLKSYQLLETSSTYPSAIIVMEKY